MFSRIFATEHGRAERHARNQAGDGSSATLADPPGGGGTRRCCGCSGVALAEVGADLGRGSPGTRRRSRRLCSGVERWRAGSRRRRVGRCGWCASAFLSFVQSRSRLALGGVDTGPDRRARARRDSPVRRSRTWPRAAARHRCGRCPSGTRTGLTPGLLRRQQDRQPPSDAAATSLTEAHGAARRPRGVAAQGGWKRSMWSRRGSPAPPSARSSASSSPGGPQRNVSRSRQSGQSSSSRRAQWRRRSPVRCGAGDSAGSRRQLVAAGRRRSRRPRGARSARGRRRGAGRAPSSSRSMLLIGVMPLPALMKSRGLRQRVGQHELALRRRRGRPSSRAGRSSVKYGETTARVDQLRGDADAAVRAARVGGQRVGAPVVDAVDARPRSAGTAPAGARATRSPGRISTVDRVVASPASIRSIRPRSSCVDQSGLISSR